MPIPEYLTSTLLIFGQILKTWWWLPLVFILWKPFTFLYLWWRNEKYDSTVKKILLEIKIPTEIKKPIKAMEDVFTGIHCIHDVFNWREKWIEGQFQYSISLEIVSLGGEIHFYIRTPEQFRGIIESNIYSQYPEVEIFEVPDYTKNVPQDIPNKDWDLWGTTEINTKPDPYPIKTYKKFESENQNLLDERKVDPLAGLLEGMATLGPGEQMWIQIIAKPIREEKPWVKEGLKIRDKLVKRPEKPKPKSMIREAFEVVVLGEIPGKGASSEKEVIPPEMKLTPGEREIVQGIEEKIGKFGYVCTIRYIYLGKREVFFRPRARIPFGFFKAVSTENMGGFKPDKRTITKSKTVFLWFLDKRRVYLKKRRIFKYYCRRWTPYFPLSGGTFVLNTEELATLYHFPSKLVAPAPTVPRIESKKVEPPSSLPVES